MRSPTRPPSPARGWRQLQAMKYGDTERADLVVGDVVLLKQRGDRERLRVSLHRKGGAPQLEVAVDVLTSDGGWMRSRPPLVIRMSEAAEVAEAIASVAPAASCGAGGSRP